ncbi:chorismate mutase [Prosthecochloris sp. GSB1]|uniref:chorismate mutase n=1 Tax=Prosthecochloris sp. GSB1 TaxID=281093 RepID=UPI000B8CF806|nr:chorismate mutase [Prosthecochloris sp. GSB1]ASQ91509.1 chorismate mutase [Prosthecochloris sp. GSB1]
MSNSTVNRDENRLELEAWRKKIDDIDNQLSALLCERLNCAQNISALKQRIGEEVLQPAREKEVLDNVLNRADTDLKAGALEKIYRCIIEETRLFQHEWKNERQPLSSR